MRKLALAILFFNSFLLQAQQTEKIHLLVNKDLFLPGEMVWFKAVLFVGANQGSIATNFYAALYDEQGKQIARKRYPILGGVCNGDFRVPDSINSTYLVLKAYTVNNAGDTSHNLFSRKIMVYLKNKTPRREYEDFSQNLDIRIKPEGGTLVADLRNLLLIKVTDEKGRGKAIRGAIYEKESGNLVDSVETSTNGTGSIYLVPEYGRTYFIRWNKPVPESVTTTFPAVIRNGVIIHTEWSDKNLFYLVQRTPEFTDNLHLILKKTGEKAIDLQLNLRQQQQFTGSIPVDSLPTGILELEVTDASGNIHQHKNLLAPGTPSPGIRFLEQNSDKKGMNRIEIQVADSQTCFLAATVYDFNFEYPMAGTGIFEASCLPQQGLGNSITEASEANDRKTLDLLLQFYEYNFKDSLLPAQNPDNYLSLALNYKDGKQSLPANAIANLIVDDVATGKRVYMLSPSSPKHFEMNGLIIYDSCRVFYKIPVDKSIGGYIKPSIAEGMAVPGHIQAMKLTEIRNNQEPVFEPYRDTLPSKIKDINTLKEVVVKSKKQFTPEYRKIVEMDQRYSTGFFSGLSRGYQVNALDDPLAKNAPDIISYLKFKFPGLTSRFNSQEFAQELFESRSAMGDNPPVLIFVNELETPAGAVQNIQVSEVAYVKYTPGIVIGSAFVTTGGMISIYMRRGTETSPIITGMYNSQVAGYNTPGVFTMPDYTQPGLRVNPDYRSALYWNPNIILDRSNPLAVLEYYNSDVSKKKVLIVEGFKEDGTVIRIRKVIE